MSLAPVIVTYCTLCGLPPEFCEYNTEVAHPKAAVAVEAQLASLAVGDAAVRCGGCSTSRLTRLGAWHRLGSRWRR